MEQKKTNRKKIENIIDLPEGIKAELDGKNLKMSKEGNEVKKMLSYEAVIKDNKIIIGKDRPTKKDKKLINTSTAHIKNMIVGLEEKYVYKLFIASVHFPMTVTIQGKEVIIKNFLGEKQDRKAKIVEGVEVKIEGEIVTVEGIDKEAAGQTAANIETATKIRNRDRRIFQDGIFITEKQKGARKK